MGKKSPHALFCRHVSSLLAQLFSAGAFVCRRAFVLARVSGGTFFSLRMFLLALVFFSLLARVVFFCWRVFQPARFSAGVVCCCV